VRRRRWLDTENHNVMSEFDFIQESTHCSKELADVKGTKAKEVTSVLKKIPEAVRLLVEEVTLDFSDSMHQIVSACFPKAMIPRGYAGDPLFFRECIIPLQTHSRSLGG